MNKTNGIFATNLTALLESRGLNQIDFASKIGAPKANVSCWLNGIKIPRVESLERIASFFNVRVADLFAEPNYKAHSPRTPEKIKAILDIAVTLDDSSIDRLASYAQALKDMR